MKQFLIALVFVSAPLWAEPTPTPTPQPKLIQADRLGPGPIVSLWRALPNPLPGGNQQVRIANVGDAATYLDHCSLSTRSSDTILPLTGFLGPGENRFVSLPTPMLSNTAAGDTIILAGGGAIFQGQYQGPVGPGVWVQLQWISEGSSGVRLSRIIPDSGGDDDNTGIGEKFWVINESLAAISLQDWTIRDRAETDQIIELSGTVSAGDEATFENKTGQSIFNNDDPDCILLFDADGFQVDSGSYKVPPIEDTPTEFIPCE